MKIKELSKISGVSVRTLQFYDNEGLLKPHKLENNYREYSEGDIDRLQEILFFRKLNFKLKEIKELLDKDGYSRLEALRFQKEMLDKYMDDLSVVMDTLTTSIEHMEDKLIGDKKMSSKKQKNEDKFKGLNFDSNPYEAEARERWGDKVSESNKLISSKSDNEKEEMKEKMNSIFKGFAGLTGHSPQSDEVQYLVKEFHEFLNQNVGSFYNKEVFKGLGEMYVADSRFTENLDQFGDGTAKLMSEALIYFSDKKL